MGTYGDGGNSVVLRQRLRLRGIDAEVVEITLADPVPAELDLYTLGGAEDYAQRLATRHLIRYPGLQQAAARGAPVLAICAAIQVLGHWYETSSGERVDGVGMLDVTTSPQDKRTIGEVVSQPLLPELSERLTGFENHRGGTVLGSSAQPLAKVISGAGNRLGDGIDGAVQGSVVATYLHGPCLARNPQLADYLLSRVVGDLAPLEIAEVAALRKERLAAPPPRLGTPTTAYQRCPGALDDLLRPVLFDHLIDNPPQASGLAQGTDVFRVLPAVGAVLIAVVLGNHHEVFPTHVRHPNEPTATLDNGDLGCGPWQSGIDV
jgi:CobQ-like glutamine amidotransferase family enzyme